MKIVLTQRKKHARYEVYCDRGHMTLSMAARRGEDKAREIFAELGCGRGGRDAS